MTHLILANILFYLFLPVAVIAFISFSNEYSAMGMENAIDCDGPLHVMMWAIPSYIVYGACTAAFTMTYLKSRKSKHLVMAIFGLAVILFITPNTITAINEHDKNIKHASEQCGDGWQLQQEWLDCRMNQAKRAYR